MTRQEYSADVQTWSELVEIAGEHGYDFSGELVSSDRICDDIKERADNIGWGDDWESFASWVSDIPQGYDFYSYNDSYDEYSGLSDADFDTNKSELFDWLDENGLFDEDEEDELEPEDEAPDEDFSVGELLTMCFIDITVSK